MLHDHWSGEPRGGTQGVRPEDYFSLLLLYTFIFKRIVSVFGVYVIVYPLDDRWYTTPWKHSLIQPYTLSRLLFRVVYFLTYIVKCVRGGSRGGARGTAPLLG